MMQKLVKYKENKKGFTLVELIVVIAIIAILAAILLPRFFSFTDDARRSAAISEAKSIRSIAEAYYATTGEWSDVSAAANFQVETGGTDALPTYADSPTFTGTINVAAGVVIPNGAFTYTKDGFVATCDASGTVTSP